MKQVYAVIRFTEQGTKVIDKVFDTYEKANARIQELLRVRFLYTENSYVTLQDGTREMVYQIEPWYVY